MSKSLRRIIVYILQDTDADIQNMQPTKEYVDKIKKASDEIRELIENDIEYQTQSVNWVTVFNPVNEFDVEPVNIYAENYSDFLKIRAIIIKKLFPRDFAFKYEGTIALLTK
jgi:hypothetical protein